MALLKPLDQVTDVLQRTLFIMNMAVTS